MVAFQGNVYYAEPPGSSCALFLGDERSLSVDVDKLSASIGGDCVYLSRMQQGTREACVYNLRDNTMGIFSMDYDLDRPFSLVHVLLFPIVDHVVQDPRGPGYIEHPIVDCVAHAPLGQGHIWT
jgi:hypothetical protein